MPEGKLDFQACRTTYVNLVFEYGDVSPKNGRRWFQSKNVPYTCPSSRSAQNKKSQPPVTQKVATLLSWLRR